jgi:hypothetical protein
MKTWLVIGSVLATTATAAAIFATQIHDPKPGPKPRATRIEEAPVETPAVTPWRPETIAPAPTATAPLAIPSAASATTAPPPRKQFSGPELRDSYEASFVAQNVDGAWAASARHTAESRLRERLPAGSSLRAVDCRSSLCRIETSHADSTQYLQFVRSALFDPSARPWGGAVFSIPASDAPPDPSSREPMIAVSYLSREGVDLPTVE